MKTLTKEQINKLKEVCQPVSEFLQKNFHPHVQIVVDCNSAEILEGYARVKFEYIGRDEGWEYIGVSD